MDCKSCENCKYSGYGVRFTNPDGDKEEYSYCAKHGDLKGYCKDYECNALMPIRYLKELKIQNDEIEQALIDFEFLLKRLNNHLQVWEKLLEVYDGYLEKFRIEKIIERYKHINDDL